MGTRGTHGYGVNSHYLGMCEEDSLGVNGGRGLSQVGRKSRFSRNGGVLQTQQFYLTQPHLMPGAGARNG